MNDNTFYFSLILLCLFELELYFNYYVNNNFFKFMNNLFQNFIIFSYYYLLIVIVCNSINKESYKYIYKYWHFTLSLSKYSVNSLHREVHPLKLFIII